MIEKIEFEDISKSTAYRYAQKLDFFKQNKSIEFKPGLNIIFAPNGTGKSTILEMLAKVSACEQGGVSTLTQSWMYDIKNNGENIFNGINIFHDGQPAVYNNPRKAVGLFGGMAAFDDDFFSEGIMEVQMRESTGYTTIIRLKKILDILTGKEEMPKNFDSKVKKLPEEYKKITEGNIPVGQQTMLLDEPESGLAIHVQSNIFKMIQKKALENKLQIIIATHSPFALTCDANFIELEPGYIQKTKYEIQMLSAMINLQDKIEEKQENNKSSVPEVKEENEKPKKISKKKIA